MRTYVAWRHQMTCYMPHESGIGKEKNFEYNHKIIIIIIIRILSIIIKLLL
jgi:hypothetical protein